MTLSLWKSREVLLDQSSAWKEEKEVVNFNAWLPFESLQLRHQSMKIQAWNKTEKEKQPNLFVIIKLKDQVCKKVKVLAVIPRAAFTNEPERRSALMTSKIPTTLYPIINPSTIVLAIAIIARRPYQRQSIEITHKFTWSLDVNRVTSDFIGQTTWVLQWDRSSGIIFAVMIIVECCVSCAYTSWCDIRVMFWIILEGGHSCSDSK